MDVEMRVADDLEARWPELDMAVEQDLELALRVERERCGHGGARKPEQARAHTERARHHPALLRHVDQHAAVEVQDTQDGHRAV